MPLLDPEGNEVIKAEGYTLNNALEKNNLVEVYEMDYGAERKKIGLIRAWLRCFNKRRW